MRVRQPGTVSEAHLERSALVPDAWERALSKKPRRLLLINGRLYFLIGEQRALSFARSHYVRAVRIMFVPWCLLRV